MSGDLSIQILNYAAPCSFGALLAVAKLSNKYKSEMRYVVGLWQTWLYILLSSIGSLVIFLLTAQNAKVTDSPQWINPILFGLLCAAAFLGIASRVSLSGSFDKNMSTQLKTLQDFVYGILDEAISRKEKQIVDRKIREACRDVDPVSFEEEAMSMLDAADIKSAQKSRQKGLFDDFIEHGQYDSVIRVLRDHYQDVDYVIERLSAAAERKRKQSVLYNLIKVALETHNSHNTILHEFIVAKAKALQKDPDISLNYLEQALQKKPALKRRILLNETDWWMLASMTHGEQQREKLEKFLTLVGIEQLTWEYIKQQCTNRTPITFMAIKKSKGDCVKITLRIHDYQDHSVKWWVRSDDDKSLNKECITLDEVMSYIEQVAIPIRLV